MAGRRKALVTGIAGFVGRHLARELGRRGRVVTGSRHIHESAEGVEADEVMPCDICEAKAVRELLAATTPDEVYHLAAVTHVMRSYDYIDLTWRTNVMGTINLYEAALSLGMRPRLLFVGTATEYGIVTPEDLPLTEDHPLAPVEPYAASKAAADIASYQYFRGSGLDILRTRSFNHTGPGQSHEFVASDFARQIARIEREGLEPAIHVGNLEAYREFLDVRDVVRAYADLMERGACGEVYHVAGGTLVTIRELLDRLLALSECEIAVRTDPARMRPIETPIFRGSAGKLKAATGWTPEIPLDKTLSDLLCDWRERVG